MMKYTRAMFLVLIATVVFAIVFFMEIPGSLAATINVPGDYSTIQGAINGSNNDDIIQVAAGTYVGSFTINKNVTIIGAGFKTTTINGNGISPVVKAESGVIAEIRGFAIVNGKPGAGGVGQETGIFCMSGSNLKIKDNSIHTGTLNGVEFATGANPSQVLANSIYGHDRYGILIKGAAPIIENNLIYYNNSSGIYSFSAQPKIRNNIIIANGWGIAYDENSLPVIENNVIMNNSIFGIGEESVDSGHSYNYNDVYNNGANYLNTSPGIGALSEDPLFVRFTVHVTSDNFALKSSSGLINAGNPGAIFNDLDGTRNDIGLYGGPNAEIPPPEPCEIIGAYWEPSWVVVGQDVSLVVYGANCDNKEVHFNVFEDDIWSNDPAMVPPNNVLFDGNTALGTWRAERHGGPLEILDSRYYFEAIEVANTDNYAISSNLVVEAP